MVLDNDRLVLAGGNDRVDLVAFGIRREEGGVRAGKDVTDMDDAVTLRTGCLDHAGGVRRGLVYADKFILPAGKIVVLDVDDHNGALAHEESFLLLFSAALYGQCR